MPDRRSFLSGIIAAGLMPKPTWADAGSPAYLSAAKKPAGDYALCGLSAAGEIVFEVALPARGHAAAAHPRRPEAVAFARRPGTFAIVLDCATGHVKARLEAPEGRHFYGHGAFSADGEVLFTTENDYAAARGVVGLWNVRDAYTRIGEFSSGGIGPHDIKLLPGGETLVVANGGIETHPETGRTKLNIPSMRPNLGYLTTSGQLVETIELSAAHRKNSIRHLAVARDGSVAFAMQWQGDLTEDLPMLGIHKRGGAGPVLAGAASVRAMNGYLGSIAISSDGQWVATTSPRAGVLQVFEGATLRSQSDLTDVCGVAAAEDGFMVTTGQGLIQQAGGRTVSHKLAWDNHLVPIAV